MNTSLQRNGRVVILGIYVTDLTFRAGRMPLIGETIAGTAFAMGPGGKVKFGPDGKNVYGRPVGVQWQNGDLVSVFPKDDARGKLLKT